MIDEAMLARQLYEEVWALMDEADRDDEENALLLHKAHASCFLWRHAQGGPYNEARGEWQVSRAYALLGQGAPALLHARRTLAICREHELGGPDLAYAHGAMAHAHALLGERWRASRAMADAIEACADIHDDAMRAEVRAELDAIDA